MQPSELVRPPATRIGADRSSLAAPDIIRAASMSCRALHCSRSSWQRGVQLHRARLQPAAARQQQSSSSSTSSSSSSSRRATSNSSSSNISSSTTPALSASLLAKQGIVMATASAVLGPLCDGLHSQHDVLHYAHPSVQLQMGFWSLETCWWVPLLFGAAGVIIGVGLPVLDQLAAQQQQQPQRQAPAWPAVLLCIALFVTQYGLSGLLEGPLLGQRLPALGAQLPALDVLLAACALATWAAFDASAQGFGMSALTALCGPAVEVVLISFGLYHYSHPEVLGVPSWIGWVYFAGGPAVGNLGRRVLCELAAQEAAADSSGGGAGAQQRGLR